MRALTVVAMAAFLTNSTLVRAQVDECVVLKTCKPKPTVRRTPPQPSNVRKRNTRTPSSIPVSTGERNLLVQARQALDDIPDRDWSISQGSDLIKTYLERGSIAGLMMLAAEGSLRAETMSAFAYYYRVGVAGDKSKARMFLRSPAKKGFGRAQSQLGRMYYYGEGGLPADQVEAARLFTLAADRGDAAGQYNVGVMYYYGEGELPVDKVETARFYRLAAEQGYAVGQSSLGVMYYDGEGGVPVDKVEAARLYRLGTNQGDALGQSRLGFMYEKGEGGLTADKVEAVRLYRLAAAQGSEFAKVQLKRLGTTP